MFYRIFTLIIITVQVVLCGGVMADNNMEFLDKSLITKLNSGIYEIVIPKIEDDNIKYSKKLPTDRLDFIERNDKYRSIGTAFFINDEELMTAAHVFNLEFFSLLQNFYIRGTDEKVYPVNMIKRYSTLRDMAVFTLKDYPEKKHILDFSSNVDIGDTVFSVGNAQGEGIAYRAGQVASFTLEREYGKWKDIRFTSPASPGNSGGPLLNLNGKVVGLIVKKNESENYNISVPIAELNNLTNQAEFHLRNLTLGLVGVEETITENWSFQTTLPAPFAEVALKAQKSLDKHMKLLGDDLVKRVEDKNFPKGERFRSYLRNQELIKGLAVLVPEINFSKWNAVSTYKEKIPLTKTQNVYKGTNYISDLQVIVEKPEDMTLQDFLNTPKLFMDTLLKAVSFNRQIANENVPVVSFGEPESTKITEDTLGRKWITSLWNLPYNDSFIYSSCLPYPKGVICNVDNKNSGYQNYGYFHDAKDNLDELVVGYSGEIKDWVEYFQLEKKHLPKLFHSTKLSFNDSVFRLKLNEISLDFDSKEVTEKSAVHFHLGYSNKDVLAEEILLFEIFPEKGGKEQYRIQPFYEPDAFSSDRYIAKWNDVINQTGAYTGKSVNKGETRNIRKTFLQTKKDITTYDDQSFAKVYVAGCNHKAGETATEQDCNSFLESITFN